MKTKVTKTDKRYSGHEYFGYVVNIQLDRVPVIGATNRRVEKIKKLHEVREWCIQTWGMSSEREHWMMLKTAGYTVPNEHWCWHTEFYDNKIYLATEKDANWFKLRWS